MRTRRRRDRHGTPHGASDRGAAAVEFALVAPLLFLVLFGIIEFGVAWNQKQGLQSAAREGARVLSLPTTSSSTACARVTASTAGLSGPFTTTVQYVRTSGATVGGSCNSTRPCDDDSIDRVRIQVTTPYDPSIPGMGALAGGTLKGEAVYSCER